MKLALITGATSGIGEELARLLAKRGVNLLLTGRDGAKLLSFSEELRQFVNVLIHPCDLKNRKEREVLIAWALPLIPDLVINNAGFGFYGEGVEIGVDKQLDMIEVNSAAVTEISIAFAHQMKEKREEGIVVNISSAAAFSPFPYFATYAATKAYVNSFSLALDQELASSGVRVLTSCPGQVWTNFAKRASEGSYDHQPGMNKMSVQFAAQEILKQIEKKKRLCTFDFNYQVAALLMRLLPYSLILPLLARLMKRRLRGAG